MLEIYNNSQIKINLNEEIRRQFIEIIKNYDEISDDLYDEIYDILIITKYNNYFQYCVTLQLMYKEVYAYFNYINKNNEINEMDKQIFKLIIFCGRNNLIENIEKNIDLFIEMFLYIINLNNIFRAKILLELNQSQNEFLIKLSPYHIYDILALHDYLGFKMLHDYYLKNKSNVLKEKDDESLLEYNELNEEVFEITEEDIVEDIINFLNYLYHYYKNIYKKIINEIIGKIYKWCYYYISNSIEIEDIDLEVRVYNLVNGCSIEEISEKIKDNQKLLAEILIRIFDDADIGYPSITTYEGSKVVTDEDINEYIDKIKRKQK